MTTPRRPPPGILGYVYSRAGAIYFSATDPRPFRELLLPVEWCTPVVAAQEGADAAPADWAAAEAAGRWVGARPGSGWEPPDECDSQALCTLYGACAGPARHEEDLRQELR